MYDLVGRISYLKTLSGWRLTFKTLAWVVIILGLPFDSSLNPMLSIDTKEEEPNRE